MLTHKNSDTIRHNRFMELLLQKNLGPPPLPMAAGHKKPSLLTQTFVSPN
jgi:hypothetical protein